jgi:hypothetical protein
MTTYSVQAGDSPARIAHRLTGNAARMAELVAANPNKPRAGTTFASLHIGEQLALPSAWRSQPQGLAGFGLAAAYSAAVTAAATALDAQLAAQGCCGANVSGSTLSNLTAAFKQAILTNASDWGSNTAAPTVTGTTINVSTAACQIAFGSELGGTLADLQAVLGSAMTYTGSYCSNSSCVVVNSGTNCGGTTPPATPGTPPPDSSCPANQIIDASTWTCAPICPDDSRPCNGQCIGYAGGPLTPQGSPCPAPQTVTPPSSGSSSSSAGPLMAGVILVGLGSAATYYAVKHRKHAHA